MDMIQDTTQRDAAQAAYAITCATTARLQGYAARHPADRQARMVGVFATRGMESEAAQVARLIAAADGVGDAACAAAADTAAAFATTHLPADVHAYLAGRIVATAPDSVALARAKRHYAATVLRLDVARRNVCTLGLPSDRVLTRAQHRYRRLQTHASVAHLRLLDLITARYGPQAGA